MKENASEGSSTIKEKIKEFITSMGNTNIEDIQDETLLFKEGIIESIGFVQLVVYLEENFGIQLTDNDLVEENFESIQAIIHLINDKITTN